MRSSLRYNICYPADSGLARGSHHLRGLARKIVPGLMG